MLIELLFFLFAIFTGLSNCKLRSGPVCSSKGIRYSNMCTFLNETCKPYDRSYDDVMIMKTMNLCQGKKDIILGKSKSIVCVLNGNLIETRQRCELMKMRCKGREIPQILHPGRCWDCSRENVCPWTFLFKPKVVSSRRKRRLRRSFMICANDGSSFKNICDFSIGKCERYVRDRTILKYEKMVKTRYGGRHLLTKCVREQGRNEPEHITYRRFLKHRLPKRS